MFITLGNVYEIIELDRYDIDLEDYKTWLEGDKPTEDNLLCYIMEKELEPLYNIGDKSSCIDSYIDDADDLFKTLKNEK